MIECPECKTKNKKGVKYCKECGRSFVEGEISINVSRLQLYKILCYVGFLWVIGFFVPEKKQKSLKYHIGQGIILSVYIIFSSLIVSLVNRLIKSLLTYEKTSYVWGIAYKEVIVSPFASFITGLFTLALLVSIGFLIYKGIKTSDDEKNTPLPFIGKYGEYISKKIIK